MSIWHSGLVIAVKRQVGGDLKALVGHAGVVARVGERGQARSGQGQRQCSCQVVAGEEPDEEKEGPGL